MSEYDFVVLELKNSENKLTNEMEKLKQVNHELETIQLVINNIMDLVLSSESSDINLVIEKIKAELNFLNEDLNILTDALPNKSNDALWKILSIVQDFYADKENEKVDIEEEIRRIRIEINDILTVLKEENKGKRL